MVYRHRRTPYGTLLRQLAVFGSDVLHSVAGNSLLSKTVFGGELIERAADCN